MCLLSRFFPVATAAPRPHRPLHQHHHQPRPLGHFLPEHPPRRPSDPQRLPEPTYLPSRMSRQHVQGGRARKVVGLERRFGGFRKGRLCRRWGQRFLPVAEDAKVSICFAIAQLISLRAGRIREADMNKPSDLIAITGKTSASSGKDTSSKAESSLKPRKRVSRPRSSTGAPLGRLTSECRCTEAV